MLFQNTDVRDHTDIVMSPVSSVLPFLLVIKGFSRCMPSELLVKWHAPREPLGPPRQKELQKGSLWELKTVHEDSCIHGSNYGMPAGSLVPSNNGLHHGPINILWKCKHKKSFVNANANRPCCHIKRGGETVDETFWLTIVLCSSASFYCFFIIIILYLFIYICLPHDINNTKSQYTG